MCLYMWQWMPFIEAHVEWKCAFTSWRGASTCVSLKCASTCGNEWNFILHVQWMPYLYICMYIYIYISWHSLPHVISFYMWQWRPFRHHSNVPLHVAMKAWIHSLPHAMSFYVCLYMTLTHIWVKLPLRTLERNFNSTCGNKWNVPLHVPQNFTQMCLRVPLHDINAKFHSNVPLHVAMNYMCLYMCLYMSEIATASLQFQVCDQHIWTSYSYFHLFRGTCRGTFIHEWKCHYVTAISFCILIYIFTLYSTFHSCTHVETHLFMSDFATAWLQFDSRTHVEAHAYIYAHYIHILYIKYTLYSTLIQRHM